MLIFGFELKNFSKDEIKGFAGSGKSMQLYDISTINDINEKQIVKIIIQAIN